MATKKVLRSDVTRQSALLSRLPNSVAKMGSERVTFFRQDKSGGLKKSGWMTKQDYVALRKDGGFSTQRGFHGRKLPEGYVKPKLNWENRIEVKCNVHREGKVYKRTVRINAYTKTQRTYTRQLLKENKIPVNKWSTNQQTINTRMDEKIEELGISSKNVRGT